MRVSFFDRSTILFGSEKTESNRLKLTKDNKIREMTVTVVFTMLIFSVLENGVLGQCSSGLPINLAVNEGTQNISMMCNSPTKVSWTFKPTTDQLGSYTITSYDDIVKPMYTNLFAVNSSGLLIKIAQGAATVPPQSTAGLYLISINGFTPMSGAKLIVVRQPPTCGCVTVNATSINITCSLTYADSGYNPINAKMTWTANGNFFRNDTPVRITAASYYMSTSTITVNVNSSATYDCTVTFAKPSITFSWVATNAPVFSESCTSPCMFATTSTTTTTTATVTSSQSATTNGPGTEVSGGLSEGGKIGIGVGIGIGVTLLVVGVVFAILCRRYEWTKRTKQEATVADDKRTNGLEADYERTQRDNPNTPPYQPLNVLSTPTTNVEATYELFESVA